MSKADNFIPPWTQRSLHPSRAKWLVPKLILTIVALIAIAGIVNFNSLR